MNLKKLNKNLYPFRANFFDTGRGKIHYIDEGEGDPVVFLHGNPTFSFLYRNQIKLLSRTKRCIAPDYLGFGSSDPPTDNDYSPKTAARDIEQMINDLDLQNITLVVHDFGGPIGLSYAIKHPERIKKVILFNTWMWSNSSSIKVMLSSAVFNSFIGKFLFLRLNFGINGLLRIAWRNKSCLTKEIIDHYKLPMSQRSTKYASWSFAKALGAENDWYHSLWEQRSKLQQIPFLILWGKKDPALTLDFLKKWKETIPHADVHLLDTGHFVPEEMPWELLNDFFDPAKI